MIKRTLPLVVLSLVAAAQFCAAAIKFVSPNPGSAPYTTISAAYSAALTGDTIVIGPGAYTENLNFAYKRVHVIGAGWDQCTLTGVYQVYGATSTQSTFEGIRFLGAGYYTFYNHTSADSLTFRRCNISAATGWSTFYLSAGKTFVTDCVLHSNAGNVFYMEAGTSGNLVARNCVFTLSYVTPHPSYNAFYGVNAGTVEIYNCVFLNYVKPFALTGIPQVIGLNNIFWDWNPTAEYGQLPVGSVFEYTASGAGAPAWPSNFAHNIDLGSNNPFVSYDNAGYYEYGVSNLHLNTNTGGNLCRDAGYPSIQDLDSSAADLGVYGGPKPFVDHGVPAYPFALTLTIDNLVEVGDSVNVVSSGRIGPRY
jgi:hypothetical protein